MYCDQPSLQTRDLHKYSSTTQNRHGSRRQAQKRHTNTTIVMVRVHKQKTKQGQQASKRTPSPHKAMSPLEVTPPPLQSGTPRSPCPAKPRSRRASRRSSHHRVRRGAGTGKAGTIPPLPPLRRAFHEKRRRGQKGARRLGIEEEPMNWSYTIFKEMDTDNISTVS